MFVKISHKVFFEDFSEILSFNGPFSSDSLCSVLPEDVISALSFDDFVKIKYTSKKITQFKTNNLRIVNEKFARTKDFSAFAYFLATKSMLIRNILFTGKYTVLGSSEGVIACYNWEKENVVLVPVYRDNGLMNIQGKERLDKARQIFITIMKHLDSRIKDVAGTYHFVNKDIHFNFGYSAAVHPGWVFFDLNTNAKVKPDRKKMPFDKYMKRLNKRKMNNYVVAWEATYFNNKPINIFLNDIKDNGRIY